MERNRIDDHQAAGGCIVQCAECGAWGPADEAGDGPEPLCPGCSDPYGIVADAMSGSGAA